ncbi:MAG TPA: hypothetical protein VHZ76_06730, partial [Gammaproteobacteria bacterium]|nr:hypothetical protein [Gammaproteobacteria bacterium]
NARSDRGGYRPKSAKPAGDRPYTPYKDKAKFAKTTDDRDYSYKAKPAKASKGEFDDAPLVTVKKRSSSSPKPWDKNKKSGYGEKKFADRDRDHKRPSSERRFSSRERDGDRDNNRDRNPAAKRGTFAGAAKPAKKYGASFKHKKAGGAGARDRKPRD